MTASGIGSVPASGGPRAMTLWRLERLRLIRTYRWLALFGVVYLVFGLLGPVMAAYLPDILSRVQSDSDDHRSAATTPRRPRELRRSGDPDRGDRRRRRAVGALAFDAHPGISTSCAPGRPACGEPAPAPIGVILAAGRPGLRPRHLRPWYATAVLLGPLPAGPRLRRTALRGNVPGVRHHGGDGGHGDHPSTWAPIGDRALGAAAGVDHREPGPRSTTGCRPPSPERRPSCWRPVPLVDGPTFPRWPWRSRAARWCWARRPQLDKREV